MRTRPMSHPIVDFLRPVGLGLASLMLSGCFYASTSQAPIATTYPYTEQQKMQAAQHWEVLAQHEAAGILSSERVRFRDLHIAAPEHEQYGSYYSGGEFERGFRTLLTSELVSGGGSVTTQPRANGATIQIDVEVVEHRDRGYTRPPSALTPPWRVASRWPVSRWATGASQHWHSFRRPWWPTLPTVAGQPRVMKKSSSPHR
ncbi:hypothetical protein [Vreelandella aquamarina]|uniref:hypothetical protein n=1 Tax=Vreelandella aquamarina TaxID=77097 RepID=UPI0020C3A835|nr:hypothetical protein [Halomonas meridiana]